MRVPHVFLTPNSKCAITHECETLNLTQLQPVARFWERKAQKLPPLSPTHTCPCLVYSSRSMTQVIDGCKFLRLSCTGNFVFSKSIHSKRESRLPDAGATKAILHRKRRVPWGEDYDLCLDATYAIGPRLSLPGLQLCRKLCRAMSCLRFRGADGSGYRAESQG